MKYPDSLTYPFDRPVIIVAAPRSGSTLLFETLSRARQFWTIGGESHTIFEHIRKLSPAHGICESNRLTHEDADTETVRRIRAAFLGNLRDRNQQPFDGTNGLDSDLPRLLEKTPKNVLRIPFLNAVFPDARYIFLFRDPRQNLSSIIEGWRSQRFVTYANLPHWPGKWSFLLPPEYGSLKGTSLEEIAAFQWRVANQVALNDLGELPADRWTAVSYADLVTNAGPTIERLCEFSDIEYDQELKDYCEAELPLSRYTQSAPDDDKWRSNEQMIDRVVPGLQDVIEEIDAAAAPHTLSSTLQTGDIEARAREQPAVDTRIPRQLSRNATCFCGTGLRFKHCHGAKH